MLKHCEAIGRVVQVVNLDPAAEHFDYPVSVGMLARVSEVFNSVCVCIMVPHRWK